MAGVKRVPPNAGPFPTLFVSGYFLVPLMAFLCFDCHGRNRPRFKPGQRNGLSSDFAIAILAFVDPAQRGIDLGDELALTVAGAQFERPIGFTGRPIRDIRLSQRFVLKGFEGIVRLAKDIVFPGQELLAKIFELIWIHKRLCIAGPVIVAILFVTSGAIRSAFSRVVECGRHATLIPLANRAAHSPPVLGAYNEAG